MTARPALIRGIRALIVATLIGSLGLVTQGADLLHVCPEGPPACSFATIAEAVAAAAEGSTIIVEAGEYTGPLLLKKNLTLIGDSQNRAVITKGVIAAGPFQITLKNFTITKGLNGIQAQSPPGLPAELSPRLSLQNVVITGNAGNGLALFNFARAALQDVTVTQNGISVLGNPVGNGIALRDHGQIAIGGRTLIQENGANGISLLDQASLDVDPQTFIRKNGLNGIQLGGQSEAQIEGVTSRENGCFGVAVNDDSNARIHKGRLESNGKAGLQIGGPASMIPGCATLSDTKVHATSTILNTIIAQNPVGILVGDLSKEFDRATAEITFVTFVGNGCDLLVDPVAEKTVNVEPGNYQRCQ